MLTDAAHMPETTLRNAVAYEDWLAEADGDFAWAAFDENTAAGMCYTSGTTGDPEGRALFAPLQRAARADGVAAATRIGPVARATGAAGGADVPRQRLGARLLRADGGRQMVMPGAKLDGASVYELLETEKVTFTAAVPTVWLMLLQHWSRPATEAAASEARGDRRLGLPARDDARSSRTNYGVEVIHAWGMTEMSPLGTLCTHEAGRCGPRRRGAARRSS